MSTSFGRKQCHTLRDTKNLLWEETLQGSSSTLVYTGSLAPLFHTSWDEYQLFGLPTLSSVTRWSRLCCHPAPGEEPDPRHINGFSAPENLQRKDRVLCFLEVCPWSQFCSWETFLSDWIHCWLWHWESITVFPEWRSGIQLNTFQCIAQTPWQNYLAYTSSSSFSIMLKLINCSWGAHCEYIQLSRQGRGGRGLSGGWGKGQVWLLLEENKVSELPSLIFLEAGNLDFSVESDF